MEQTSSVADRPEAKAWLPLIIVVATSLFALWWWHAETPFGIGNGKVPDLVGRNVCSATAALAKRELRWRVGTFRVVQTKAEHNVVGESFDCSDDKVLRQSPSPGTDVGTGGVVWFATQCSEVTARGGGCQ